MVHDLCILFDTVFFWFFLFVFLLLWQNAFKRYLNIRFKLKGTAKIGQRQGFVITFFSSSTLSDADNTTENNFFISFLLFLGFVFFFPHFLV